MFNPGLVLVSAGFDAAEGHPPTLGGYSVSPACFASMTSSLMQLAEGKVVLALEGGYVGPAVPLSVLECLRVLLGESCMKISSSELEKQPSNQAVIDISNTISHLVSSRFIDCIDNHINTMFQVSCWPVLRESSKWINVSHLCYLDNHPLDVTAIRNLQV